MSRAVTLAEIADEIRSKNAGPFELTFDILFDDERTYQKVKSSGVRSTHSRLVFSLGIE